MEKQKQRIGLKNDEISTLCMGTDALCSGIDCPQYPICWEYLNPDGKGYFGYENRNQQGVKN